VIPAYNEEQRLRRHIPVIAQHLRGRAFEIIVVDDGSADATARASSELAKQYPMLRLICHDKNRGKGAAVRTGMLAARGRHVLFTDADLSTPIDELYRLLEKLQREGYDVAIGSRAAPGAQVLHSQAWYRALAGRAFGWATKLLCLRGIADTQCGFKLMTREAAHRVFPQVSSDTAIFDIEMLVVMAREGCRVAEVPVRWVHDPDTRIPYNLRRALQIWAELFRIRRAQKLRWPLKVKS
jgi:dolichyl-phosphate beta-glucosyltransferase